MLLSFERPRSARNPLVRTSRRPLKTAQQPHARPDPTLVGLIPPLIFDEPGEGRVIHRVGISMQVPSQNDDHRQDSKGTWWMPWHLEPMKDVDDCDKPR